MTRPVISRILLRTESASMNPIGLEKQNEWPGGEPYRGIGSSGIAEDSEDCSIEISEEVTGNGDVLAPFSFNPEHDDSVRRKETCEIETLRLLQAPEFR